MDDQLEVPPSAALGGSCGRRAAGGAPGASAAGGAPAPVGGFISVGSCINAVTENW